MVWFIVNHIITTILDFITIGRLSTLEKDLEILVLRQQLSILQRKINSPVKPSRVEKLTLTVITIKLKQITQRSTQQLHSVIRIFQPETILRWQREIARKKWTYSHDYRGGRPSVSKEIENLILQFAQENIRWGYGKIHGELRKLGFKVSKSTVRNVLTQNSIQPAPVRNGSIGWRDLMSHYKEQLLACDFFTVETIWFQTIYVLFFIELGSRRVHFAGVTTNPDAIWVSQQARQLVWKLSEGDQSLRFLLHDNDSSFGKAFDAVFLSEGFQVIPTPFQAPNANAFAERWIRTAREECLDHILIFSAAHLRRVLTEFVDYYNTSRPHQGIEQQTPIPYPSSLEGAIHSRKILGGIINDYFRKSNIPALLTI
ncbi:MAG: transposase [Chloroflexi bacterium]|nr:transposase [Chloroflexota bacterium]